MLVCLKCSETYRLKLQFITFMKISVIFVESEFKYLGVLIRSEGRIECEMNR